MKMSDMRAKARAIFGPAIAEPMPKQPNGAKALQQRANARPIPTYKVGGPVKKPMPTPADLAAAKAQNEMIKKATVSKKDAATIAAGNRASALQGAEMRRMKMAEGGKMPDLTGDGKVTQADVLKGRGVKGFAKGGVQTSSDTARKLATEMGGMRKGGKVKKSYADDALVMGGAASDTKGLGLGLGLPKDIGAELRRGMTDKELMDANLNAVRGRETAEATKKQSFGEAFAAARKRGDKTFTWNGGSYGTKMKGEDSKPASPYSASTSMKDIARNTSTSNSRPPAPSKSTNPYSSNTPTKNIARNIDTSNAQMSDAQLRNFTKSLNADADRSLDDTEIRKFVSDNDRAADRSLAAMKAKKEAEEKRRLSSMVSGISKATTASLSDAARRAASRTPGMAKGGKVKEPKPKDGLAVMIAIGKPMKPAKKMNGGAMAGGSRDMEASKVTRAMAMGGDPMGYMGGGTPMGYAAGGAGKMRKGQAPIKKAQGGAAKVRKGMMTPEGNIIDAMNKMRGK
jgi:hypothetical protein